MSTDRVIQLEFRRQAEQARLDSLKQQAERNRLGQFATPPALSLELARYARVLWGTRSDRVRFLDPALGTGSFYSALRQAFPEDRIEAAAGVELDPAFAQAARALWEGTGLRVTNADFTRLPPPPPDQRYNLILSNPPYVRHHHLPMDDKHRLKAATWAQLALNVSGLAGLYCYFMFLCHCWLAEGGLAVWLMPSEFMEVKYGATVRRYLTERVTLLRIHRFDPAEVQFDDALVTSAVVVLEQRRPGPGHCIEFSHGGTLTRPGVTEVVALADLRNSRKWTSSPQSAPDGPDVAPSTRLGDLFRIKRGLATGSNSFFIVPRAVASARGIPEIALKPVLPGPRRLSTAVVETDADGWPALPEQLALIDCSLPEDEVQACHPQLWKYLRSGARKGVNRGYLASRRRPWYSQEHREPAPFLCTYMGRQGATKRPFRFIWNKSDAVASNVYLLLYPRPALARALRRNPLLSGVVFQALNQVEGESLIGEARVYGGGLHKLEPSELAALPAEQIARAALTQE